MNNYHSFSSGQSPCCVRVRQLLLFVYLIVSIVRVNGTQAERSTVEKVYSTEKNIPNTLVEEYEEPLAMDTSSWDSALKTLGLREKNIYDIAALRYYKTLQELEKEFDGPMIENQINSIDEIRQILYENIPTLPKGISRISELPENVQNKYRTVTKNLQSFLNRHDFFPTDKTFNERLRKNITNAFHNFKIAIGAEEPGYIEAIQYATVRKNGLAGNLDKILKWTGLREKSVLENARDNFRLKIHQFNAAMGNENPYFSERLGQFLINAQDHLDQLIHYPIAARAESEYEQVSAAVAASLLRLQDQTEIILKKTGLKKRTLIEETKKQLDESIHTIFVALGYADPTFLEKLSDIWHKAKVRIHLEEPTFLEKAQANLHRTSNELVSYPEKEIRKVWSRVFGRTAA
jgi:hypothetical protein